MQPKLIWFGVAVAFLASGLVPSETRAQAALTGLVSSSDEGAMEGVLVSAKKAVSTVTTTVVDAVGKRATIFVDSGIRRGTDVVKALALGANAVMVGRSTLYGVAAGGEAGASRALAIYRDEISRVLALLGCVGLGEVGPQHILFADPHLRPVGEAKGAERMLDGLALRVEQAGTGHDAHVDPVGHSEGSWRRGRTPRRSRMSGIASSACSPVTSSAPSAAAGSSGCCMSPRIVARARP